MTELSRIMHQFENCFKGNPYAWHGSSLLPTIENILAEKAIQRPIPEVHNIWELVNHITIWRNEAKKSLEGDSFPFLPDDQEWPPIHDKSEEAWKETIDKLIITHKGFMETLTSFDPTLFDVRINIGEPWSSPWLETTFYELIYGTLHHEIYHTGQIALLKKKLQ